MTTDNKTTLLTEPAAVSRDLIVSAYKAFLGREPESERVVRQHLERHKSIEEVLSEFLNSEEFKKKYKYSDYGPQVRAGYHGELGHIDVDVKPDVFLRLFDRVRDQWTAIGETEPFWSVLSHDRFRMSSIKETKKDFYASGADADRLIDIFCRRSNVRLPSGTCFELGCGVGRVTRFLAERFDHVIGADISRGNLDLAGTYLHDSSVPNVDLILLRDLEQLEDIDGYDFFYSVIVLQHNPPPIMARMLSIILKKLRSGGAFLFQVPTHVPAYEFSVQSYLESDDLVGVGFDMHALPMHIVFQIIQEAGGHVKEAIADTWTGGYGSHTFFGIKS